MYNAVVNTTVFEGFFCIMISSKGMFRYKMLTPIVYHRRSVITVSDIERENFFIIVTSTLTYTMY